MRIARHDRVRNTLDALAKARGFTTAMESSVTLDDGSVLRPDLMLISRNGPKTTVKVVDVTVRFESVVAGVSTLELARGEKVRKYNSLVPKLADVYATDVELVTVHPFVVGSRGALLQHELKFLVEEVGLSKRDALHHARMIALGVIRSGVRIIDAFMDRTVTGGGRPDHQGRQQYKSS